MGKVISLTTARKSNRLVASLSANDQAAHPQKPPWSVRLCRLAMRAMKALCRAFLVGLLEVILSVVLALRKATKFLCGLGFIVMLVLVVFEGMNQWRDKQIVIAAIVSGVAFVLVSGFYDSFITKIYAIQSQLKRS